MKRRTVSKYTRSAVTRFTAHKVGWLDTTAIVLSIWLIIYPHPYKVLFSIVACLPIAGLILNGTSRPSVTSLVTINEKKTYDLTEFIQMPAIAMLLRVLVDFEFESFYSLLKVGSVGFLLLLVILVATHRHINSSAKHNYVIYLIIIGNIALFSYSATYGLNCVFDPSDPVVYNAKVLDKHISTGKSKTHYIKVEPWGHHLDPEDIRVSSDEYNSFEIGQTVDVHYRQGLFNIPWYYINGLMDPTPKRTLEIINTDSLNIEDSSTVNLLYDISYNFADEQQYDSSLVYSDKALKMATKLNFDLGRARAYSVMGVAYDKISLYEEALKKHNLSLEILQRLKYKKGIAAAYTNIGNVYLSKADYPNALSFYTQALQLRKELGDDVETSSAYINLAIMYTDQGNKREAEKSYMTALQLAEQTDDKLAKADLYRRIAAYYADQNNKKEASKYYGKLSHIQKDTTVFTSN